MELVFLDVNIPTYAAGIEHELKIPCTWIMEEVVEGRLNAGIDTEIIQEVLYRYGAIRQWNVGARIARNLLAIIPTIYSVTPDDSHHAIELFSIVGPKGIPPRDCIHAAVMKNHSITKILTTDMHFDSIEGVFRLDPMEYYSQEIESQH